MEALRLFGKTIFRMAAFVAISAIGFVVLALLAIWLGSYFTELTGWPGIRMIMLIAAVAAYIFLVSKMNKFL